MAKPGSQHRKMDAVRRKQNREAQKTLDALFRLFIPKRKKRRKKHKLF